jgi:F-type H+-transporting ATPase subunit b
MELLTKLGIDWRLLIAQAVNFLIVLAVLYKFLYKPLLKFLEQRRQRIEHSLQEAQRIETELKAIEVKREEVLIEAKRGAQAILKEAEVQAEKQRQETLIRVRAEAERVISEARSKLEAEQVEAMREMRREAAKLVVQAVTKVVGKLSASEIDKKLVEEAVQEVAKRN